MKKVFLLLVSMLINIGFANAQIGEVKVIGNQAKIYDESGSNTNRYVSMNSGYELLGYNSKFIVMKDGNQAKIFDAKGNFTFKYVGLCSNCKVVNVSPSAILVKDGNMTKYYDFDGNYTNKYTSE